MPRRCRRRRRRRWPARSTRAPRSWPRPPTISSCSPPTAPSAGPAMRWPSWSRPTTRCIRGIRIIADERLTGAPREAVQARLDLWLKTHIEKLLGPLFELAKAEDITGIARGIAFQLIEALGVLERTKIAAEMKDLDQPSRAIVAQIRRALRRLSHLCAGAAEAGGARAGVAAVGAEAGQCRHVGAVGRAASGGSGPHLVPGRQGAARATPIACSAIASAASARCGSISWSGSPI